MQAKTFVGTWAVVVGLVGSASASEPSSVGFIKVTVPVGYSLIANPLDAGDNSIGALFPQMPDGTVIYKLGGSPPQYSYNAYERGWTDPSQTLKPGEGAFFHNPGPEPLTLVFVGEVLQGKTAHAIPQGFSIRSSLVPLAGPLDTVLDFPIENGDTVYRFRCASNPNGYSLHAYEFGQWSSSPYIGIGEAFFVNKVAPAVWSKSFSVND